MIICSPFRTCVKSASHLSGCVRRQMSRNLCMVFQSPSSSHFLCASSCHLQSGHISMSVSNIFSGSSAIDFQAFQGNHFRSGISKPRGNWHSLVIKSLNCSQAPKRKFVDVSFVFQNMNVRVLVPKQGMLSKIKCNVGRMSWPRGFVSAGLAFGLLVSYSSSKLAHAEAASPKEDEDNDCTSSFSCSSHGKKVFVDYSVIGKTNLFRLWPAGPSTPGIPGDGRCLFRSVVHGACLRSGKSPPSESFQKELADELRASVADEFVKRRKETEWFIEGDFDTYVSKMRKPHVWGGEPELLMASHVLRMPITVYMHDEDSGGLISIAEYGQEYGKENPIRVLYHGFGHYDALQIPGKGPKPRL